MTPELFRLLICPACRCRLAGQSDSAVLACPQCGRRIPIVDGIPRFVDLPVDDLARRTQASFGDEWTHFNQWERSGATNFADYFAGVDFRSLKGTVVLDAGCGMGRHARQIAAHAGRVVAVDFSRAIDQAARNAAGIGNVECVQADLLQLPLADASFDYVYSLGVLHHLTETDAALAGLVRALRPGGRLRIYLYWKRHGLSGQLLRLVSALRLVTTRLPFSLLRGFCRVLSMLLFGFVVLPYRALSAAGVTFHRDWPLFVYTKYPFYVLYNDQFDRFSAPLEKRYDREQVQHLLERAGLKEVTVQPCFGWVAEGVKA
jgi:SAM-dependent methyltransferase